MELQIFTGVFCGVMIFLSVVGNLIVLYSYATTKKLQTYANYFIVGLALLDSEGSTVFPLFTAYWMNGIWPFSKQLCEAYKFLSHTVGFTSYLFTLVICVDRYQALKDPFKHLRQRSKLRAFSAMSVALTISVLSWIGPLIIWPRVAECATSIH